MSENDGWRISRLKRRLLNIAGLCDAVRDPRMPEAVFWKVPEQWVVVCAFGGSCDGSDPVDSQIIAKRTFSLAAKHQPFDRCWRQRDDAARWRSFLRGSYADE